MTQPLGWCNAQKEWCCESCGETIRKKERHLIRNATFGREPIKIHVNRIGMGGTAIRSGFNGVTRWCEPCVREKYPEELE